MLRFGNVYADPVEILDKNKDETGKVTNQFGLIDIIWK